MSKSSVFADMANQGVTAAEFDFLNTTGTPSATTFLRGDKAWAAAGSTSATDLTSGTLPAARLAVGSVLQIVQTIKTDWWSTTAYENNPTLVTGLSRTITPASTSNKILVQASVYASATVYSQYLWIKHNGSGSYANLSDGTNGSVGTGDPDGSSGYGSRTPVMFGGQGGTAESHEASTATMSFLDSPGKDTEFTYQVYACQRHAGTMYINRPATTTDAAYISVGISSLTLWEIKG